MEKRAEGRLREGSLRAGLDTGWARDESGSQVPTPNPRAPAHGARGVRSTPDIRGHVRGCRTQKGTRSTLGLCGERDKGGCGTETKQAVSSEHPGRGHSSG